MTYWAALVSADLAETIASATETMAAALKSRPSRGFERDTMRDERWSLPQLGQYAGFPIGS